MWSPQVMQKATSQGDNFWKLGLKVLEIVFHVSAVKHLFQQIREEGAKFREG